MVIAGMIVWLGEGRNKSSGSRDTTTYRYLIPQTAPIIEDKE